MGCNFIFCLHNHQPVGNFDHVFEWGFKDSYNKAMEILAKYPEFKFAVHHSGPLLEWIESHHPEYFQTLRTMVDRGQLEIIGGGFYEPIFSIISESDINGQLEMMQNYCMKKFGKIPSGFWTAERVWDPEIPRLVSNFGLEYTILDDNHFRYAGIEEDNLFGYFLTERLSHTLKIFPIDKFLRYSIPFKMPVDTINYFREKTDRFGDCAFVYGDDGEKFGMWPGTFKWVFEEKWLVNFIEAVLKEGWINTIHPGDYIKTNGPRGRVYLTQGSYFELSEWALPAKVASRLVKIHKEIKDSGRENDFYSFLKGGVWNNFLNKYPESNALNKRTLLLSREINDLEKKSGRTLGLAKEELYKSECNCAYWHGLFGGIYLSSLRNALNEHLLAAESACLTEMKIKDILMQEQDFWNEGGNQILVRKNDMSALIVPYYGGAVSELGLYEKRFNIFSVIPRRYEAYHDILASLTPEQEKQSEEVKSIHDMVIVKEKGLKKYLVYDSSRRYSFKDLVFGRMPLPEELMLGNMELLDCGSLNYDYSTSGRGNNANIDLSRKINYNNNDIHIQKSYVIKKTGLGISCDYIITTHGNIFLGVELNINLLAAHEDDRRYEIQGVGKDDSYLDSLGATGGLRSFSLVDKFNGFKIAINTSREATLVRYPIFTVSQSDRGFEKNYQGCSLVLVYEISGISKFSLDVNVS